MTVPPLKNPAPLAGAITTAESKPYHILSKFLVFPNADQEQWWQNTAPLLSRIFESAGYSESQQYLYLSLYRNMLVPNLGPIGHPWHCSITHSGIPVEFSINYQDHGPRTVRIGYEPISHISGTSRDLYNQITALDALTQLSRLPIQGFDTQLFHHFGRHLTLSKGESASLKGATIPGSKFKSQSAYGLDLKSGEVTVKCYMYPALKQQVTGRGLRDLLNNALHTLGSEMCPRTILDQVNTYMEESGGYNQYSFIGFDCVDSSKSRLKIYGALLGIDLDKVEDIWTLGGRATDPINQKGLTYLKQLWNYLTDDKRQRPVGIWNYELAPNSTVAIPKFYIDVNGENDMKNAIGLTKFFEHLGWTENAQTYIDTFRSYFPDRDPKESNELIQYVSFAYTEKTGVYLSVYYHSSSVQTDSSPK